MRAEPEQKTVVSSVSCAQPTGKVLLQNNGTSGKRTLFWAQPQTPNFRTSPPKKISERMQGRLELTVVNYF